MAPHSSTLAWKIPWTEEPGRLQSMGSLRVGHDRVTSLSLFTFMHWILQKNWDSDCSHEIKRGLLLGRKAKTNLDSILKSRDFANKGLSSQSYPPIQWRD